MKEVVLVDYSWMYHKSWAVFKNFEFKHGDEVHRTGGMFGCINDVRRLQTTYSRDVRLVLEPFGGNHRKEMSDTYKAGRHKDPDMFQLWDETIKMLLKIPEVTAVSSQDKGEADDLIYTLYKRGNNADTRFFVFTRDKDLIQIGRDDEEESKRVFGLAFKMKQKEPISMYDASYQFFGVPPSGVAFVKSLLGDGSDNVPRIVPRFPSKLVEELACHKTPERCIDYLVDKKESAGGLNKWEALLLENQDRWMHHWDLVRLIEVEPQAYAPVDDRHYTWYAQRYGMIGYDRFMRNWDDTVRGRVWSIPV